MVPAGNSVTSAVPDIGYPSLTKQALLQDLIDVKRYDAAQHLADEVLAEAQQKGHPNAQAVVLTLEARIERQRHDDEAALRTLQRSMALSESHGFVGGLADAQALASDIYRDRGELEKATQFANLV